MSETILTKTAIEEELKQKYELDYFKKVEEAPPRWEYKDFIHCNNRRVPRLFRFEWGKGDKNFTVDIDVILKPDPRTSNAIFTLFFGSTWDGRHIVDVETMHRNLCYLIESSLKTLDEDLSGYGQEWIQDCLEMYGEVLTGDKAHNCPDWDDMPIDETCEGEIRCCQCDLTNVIEKNQDLKKKHGIL